MRRSPGLRVRMMRSGYNLRPSQGSGPVAGGGFLAYSCAAARDFHPLPCLRSREDARSAET